MSPTERTPRTVIFFIGILLLIVAVLCFFRHLNGAALLFFIPALVLLFLSAAGRTPPTDQKEPASSGFASGLKKGLTRVILIDSALDAFGKLPDSTQQELMKNGVKLGLLAALNPEKTKKAKEFLTGGNKQSTQERLNELKTLRENQLITAQEYEAKKAEIINQL
jgi:hypothetical protein